MTTRSIPEGPSPSDSPYGRFTRSRSSGSARRRRRRATRAARTCGRRSRRQKIWSRQTLAQEEGAMPVNTLNGQTFDARPDRVDLRDQEYQPRLRSLPPQFPSPADAQRYLRMYEADGMILDQGQ